MRKFSITNKGFTGEIIIAYTDTGILVCVDATETNCTEKHLRWLFAKVPVTITGDYGAALFKFLEGTQCHLVEIAPDVSFDTFWKLYARMVNRKRAEVLYSKLSAPEKYLCIQSVKAYDKYLNRVSWRTKQDPDTYIRNRNFLTEWDKLKD